LVVSYEFLVVISKYLNKYAYINTRVTRLHYSHICAEKGR